MPAWVASQRRTTPATGACGVRISGECGYRAEGHATHVAEVATTSAGPAAGTSGVRILANAATRHAAAAGDAGQATCASKAGGRILTGERPPANLREGDRGFLAQKPKRHRRFALPPHSTSEGPRYKPMPALTLCPRPAQHRATRRRRRRPPRGNANKHLTRPRGSCILYTCASKLVVASFPYMVLAAATVPKFVSTHTSRRSTHGPRKDAAPWPRIARDCA